MDSWGEQTRMFFSVILSIPNDGVSNFSTFTGWHFFWLWSPDHPTSAFTQAAQPCSLWTLSHHKIFSFLPWQWHPLILGDCNYLPEAESSQVQLDLSSWTLNRAPAQWFFLLSFLSSIYCVSNRHLNSCSPATALLAVHPLLLGWRSYITYSHFSSM